MKSKLMLTLTTDYVADWGVVEGVRELFQNAIDQQTLDIANTMSWSYNPDTLQLLVCNKTSSITADSLLLGSSTKQDSSDMIGQFGEGYKLALLVLTRLGKAVRVLNYAKREIWTAKFVKSRKFNGALVLEITIETIPIWQSVPTSNLTWEVNNILEEEYAEIAEKNLLMQPDVKCLVEAPNGGILLDPKYKEQVFVQGLYVGTVPGLSYGYSLKANQLKLDRDRRLVAQFNLQWTLSNLWLVALNKDPEQVQPIVANMIEQGAIDTTYITSQYGPSRQPLYAIAETFINANKRQHGLNLLFVKQGTIMPPTNRTVVFTTEAMYDLINAVAPTLTEIPVGPTAEDIYKELVDFKDSIWAKINSDDLAVFDAILTKFQDLYSLEV